MRFVNGPLSGNIEAVDFGPLGLSALALDTHTLEFPHGFTLAGAIAANQVRLIEEKTPLKSLPHRIVRYRNGQPGVWIFIKPD